MMVPAIQLYMFSSEGISFYYVLHSEDWEVCMLRLFFLHFINVHIYALMSVQGRDLWVSVVHRGGECWNLQCCVLTTIHLKAVLMHSTVVAKEVYLVCTIDAGRCILCTWKCEKILLPLF